jgi:hypothetical protein
MASAHHHHEHHGHDLADAAQAALTAAGEQWTDMRADIFAVLATFDKPASAYDIADLVSQKRGKRVAPNSVYRILDLFVANNLASGWKAPTPISPMPIPAATTTASSWSADTCKHRDHMSMMTSLTERMSASRRRSQEGFHVANARLIEILRQHAPNATDSTVDRFASRRNGLAP